MTSIKGNKRFSVKFYRNSATVWIIFVRALLRQSHNIVYVPTNKLGLMGLFDSKKKLVPHLLFQLC